MAQALGSARLPQREGLLFAQSLALAHEGHRRGLFVDAKKEHQLLVAHAADAAKVVPGNVLVAVIGDPQAYLLQMLRFPTSHRTGR